MPEIIAIVNQKGGVGKTTTSINLAAYLATESNRVLLIDADSQGNASSGLGIKKSSLNKNFYNFLIENSPISNVIYKTETPNLDIIPANLALIGIDQELAGLEKRERTLKKRLEPNLDCYDYILIDSPPNLNLLSINIMVAATSLIIPSPPEYLPLEGLADLIDTYKRVKLSYNQQLSILGVLVTMYTGNNKLSKEVTENLRHNMGDLVFKTVIPKNVRLAEAPGFCQPINIYDPRSSGAISYHALAREVIARTSI